MQILRDTGEHGKDKSDKTEEERRSHDALTLWRAADGVKDVCPAQWGT